METMKTEGTPELAALTEPQVWGSHSTTQQTTAAPPTLSVTQATPLSAPPPSPRSAPEALPGLPFPSGARPLAPRADCPPGPPR